MYRRYQKASPRERSALLDEMEAVTDLHRKSLIRLMRGPVPLERKPRRNERGPVYGLEVRAAVSLIAQALDYPSANLPSSLPEEVLAPVTYLLTDDLAPVTFCEVSGIRVVPTILTPARLVLLHMAMVLFQERITQLKGIPQVLHPEAEDLIGLDSKAVNPVGRAQVCVSSHVEVIPACVPTCWRAR